MEKHGLTTAEDTALVKRYLIVPLILDAFERDEQNFQLGLLYTECIAKAMDMVAKELAFIRTSFVERSKSEKKSI